MDWFGLFRIPAKRPRAPSATPALLAPAIPPSPDSVRRLLFDAVAAGDDAQLEQLCREHKDWILEHGAGWLEVPEAFRANPEAYEWYGNGLRAIARYCAEKLGRTDAVSIAEPSGEPYGGTEKAS